MPCNVRNFWIEIEVDGKATKVAVGPKSKDGGFGMKILVRENGDISSRKMIVKGWVSPDGNLVLQAFENSLEEVQIVTKR